MGDPKYSSSQPCMSPAKHDWARASIAGSLPSPVGGCVAAGAGGRLATVVGAASGVNVLTQLPGMSDVERPAQLVP